mmetsp:Transcript_19215/g.30440  ORF Transcript_19215/g.30440 Transcript_19215/m.30440 type:complete len:149 (-) Transcript_19215:356-802(-)
MADKDDDAKDDKKDESNQAEKPDVDLNAIGKAFVEHYYTLFDNNRLQLADLYQDTSMLSFENEQYAGKKQIMAKLCNGVFFKKVQHVPKTLDVQPSGANGLMIMCTGELKVDEEKNALKYGQMFHLLPTDNTFKRFWLHNDIFRLNYC